MNNRVHNKGLAVVLIIALLIMTAIGIKLAAKEEEIILSDNVDYVDIIKEENLSYIYVDVDGAVNNPGVYELRKGDRVIDAINKAGGLTEDAYTKNLNKARVLVDGEKIYILTKEEIENDTEENSLININKASMNDLMSLPGIGEIYAKRIIEYRGKKPFGSIEEIKNVNGIGDKTFEKIKEMITVE